MRGRKTLIAGGCLAGLLVGAAVEPSTAVLTGLFAGFLVWLFTSKPRQPVNPIGPSDAAGQVAPGMYTTPPPPPPASGRPSPRVPEAVELEHIDYARGLISEALWRGLIDPEARDRLRALIEERRQHALVAVQATTAVPSAPPVSAGPPPGAPAVVGPPPPAQAVARPMPAAAPHPSPAQEQIRRIKELIASDVAVHGLAYLGVLLLFAGAFGFTLFSFNSVRVGLRPVAEIALPGMLLASAWFLRRKGAPSVATGLGLIGGLLLPVMLFASFVDGVPFPPELQGTALALTLAAVSLLLAAAYAAYAARQPEASLRYLVGPMVWFAFWAVGLLFARGATARIDLRKWSAGQLAFVSLGVAATAVLPRLRLPWRLSPALRVAAVPGIAIGYVLSIALAYSEGWPTAPVVAAGLATIATVELLVGPAPDSVPISLLQAGVLGVAVSALVVGLGYASGGAITALAYVGLLEWQESMRRGRIARLVSGVGIAVGLGLSLAEPWASIVAFGGVAVWAHVRRAVRLHEASREEAVALDVAAAVLPAGTAWGLLTLWPNGPALVALASVPLALAVAMRVRRSDEPFFAWWVPAAAASVVAGTVAVRATAEPWPLAAAAAVGMLAIALSPRWATARVWATSAALFWTTHLAFHAAGVPFRYLMVAWSAAGLTAVAVASVRRADRLAGHFAGAGTLASLAGLVAAPGERTRLAALAAWTAVWFVTVIDQERGGAPAMTLAVRSIPGGARSRAVAAAVPAVILVTTLPFLVTQVGLQIDPIAGHRSWSGVVLSVVAIGYAAAARALASRRPLSALLAVAAFALSAVGIAVAAPDPWPSIQAVAALIVAVIALGGVLRRPIMAWVAWAASGVLVLLLAGRAGVPARFLPEVVLGWGAVLMVGGLGLDDVRSSRRAPGQGLRQPWLVPPVALGALGIPVGLAFILTGTHNELAVWSLAGAALYALVALLLRAGSVSAASYALLVVGVGALTGSSVLDRPWTSVVWGAAFVAVSLATSRAKAPRDAWLGWDVAPLVIAHGVAAVALARSIDVGWIPATWAGTGAISAVLAAWRGNAFWAVGGAALIGVGAGAAGPGWLALALGAYSACAVVLAIRSRGPLRTVIQAAGMALAAASWSQVVVWQDWSASRTAAVTALVAASIAVVTGGATRWARLPADWAANLGALSVAGGLAVAAGSLAMNTRVDPHTASELLALVTASLSVGAALAARPTGIGPLREACTLLAASSGLLLGYGRELGPGPLTAWWAVVAIVTTLAVLALWRARQSSPWVRPLALLGGAGSVITIAVAASAAPRKDLLEAALLVAGIQTAAAGIGLRRPEPLYLSPLLFCGAWLLFASEALRGEIQWFTVPAGLALLSVVGIARVARRREGDRVMPEALLALEYFGMAFVVGDGLVESVAVSPARGLFALAFGVGLAAWGALSKVRRRALLGAGAAVLAVVLMVIGPIARLVPRLTGPALWVALAIVGIVFIVVATGLERGREKVSTAIRRLDALMEGWE